MPYILGVFMLSLFIMPTSLTESPATAAIVGRINTLHEQSARQWGSMSIEQMLVHCADQIRICIEEKPARSFGNGFTQWLSKLLFLKLGMKFPKNARTLPELDPNRKYMTAVNSFEKDRQDLLALIHRFNQLPEAGRFTHPLLGKATKDEIGKIIYLHLDHHLQQFGV